MATICPIILTKYVAFPLYTWSLITIGRLTLEIYFFKIYIDDDDIDTQDYCHAKALFEPSGHNRLIIVSVIYCNGRKTFRGKK